VNCIHILTHYPTVISQSGPPKYFWSFRFEGKHKEFKIYCRTITSRKNICVTLAIKWQLKFAYALLNFKEEDCILNDVDKIQTDLLNVYNAKLGSLANSEISVYSKIFFKGTSYKINNFVSITQDCSALQLFQINEIIINDKDIFFNVNEIFVECYDAHYAAFRIGKYVNNIQKNLVFHISKFDGPPNDLSKIKNGTHMYKITNF